MELGARHSLLRRNMATCLYGEFDRPGVPLRFSDVADLLDLEVTPRGESNAEMLLECGHNDEEREMLRKESILINEKGGLTR